MGKTEQFKVHVSLIPRSISNEQCLVYFDSKLSEGCKLVKGSAKWTQENEEGFRSVTLAYQKTTDAANITMREYHKIPISSDEGANEVRVRVRYEGRYVEEELVAEVHSKLKNLSIRSAADLEKTNGKGYGRVLRSAGTTPARNPKTQPGILRKNAAQAGGAEAVTAETSTLEDLPLVDYNHYENPRRFYLKSADGAMCCKGCKIVVCNLRDICLVDKTDRVNPNPEFRHMVVFREHHDEKKKMMGKEKIFCKACDSDWGNTASNHPCLKLENFLVEIGGKLIDFHRWGWLQKAIINFSLKIL